MHNVTRLALILAAFSVIPLRAVPEYQTEYRQTDPKHYLREVLFQADPTALIIAPDKAVDINGTYLVNTRDRAPHDLYLAVEHDWIEPITPPDEHIQNVNTHDMQLREPQGSVQVALPSAPGDFQDVTVGMTVPDGAVLRTGPKSSVAVLFGGVDSVRLAPNSRAAVQMSFTNGTREVEVDMRGGIAFSKVGSRPGEKQAYRIHTPFGDARAHGTDYVTVVYPTRVDVWVAQGTVELTSPGGHSQVTISNGKEPLKVMRNPAAKDSATALADSTESLTALLDFIPLANQKLEALETRVKGGAELTAAEKDYLGRIRKVDTLIRLANVSDPAASVADLPRPKSSVPLRAQLAFPPVAEHAKPAPKPATPLVKSTPPAVVEKPVVHAAAKPIVAKTPPVTKPASEAALTSAAKPVVKKAAVATKPAGETAPTSPAATKKTAPVEKAVAAKTPPPSTSHHEAAPAPASVAEKITSTKDAAVDEKLTPPVEKATKAVVIDLPASTRPASVKKSASTKTKHAVAKTPTGDGHYLRAQPVDPADLVQAPSVNALPPASSHAAHASADPNSLGAPLVPNKPVYLTPPREIGAGSSTTP